MEFFDRWADSKNVRIHYLDRKEYDQNMTTLINIPGALNYAEQSMDLIEEFNPRRCISMSLRGRGKSDAPLTGYSLDDHVADIQAVVNQSQIEGYCMMAYSMGVPYAIKFASENPNIKGLILCDYPAKYPSIPQSWSSRILSRGYIIQERRHVVEGIQIESRATELYHELNSIHIPVLIIKGGTEESLLSKEETDAYRMNLSDVEVVELKDSGHELWEPDRVRFIQIIKDFLGKLDSIKK